MAGREISFQLARFEWVTPQRLEVEGSWNGVRRLVRATLVIEFDGETRRLRALPENGGSPEEWSAAFVWEGDEMPKLEGAELEVGRSIVVDLPRPRTSKARGAAAPAKPIPATTRAEKAPAPKDEEPRSELAGVRADLDALGIRAAEAESEVEALRARAEEAERALEALQARAEAVQSGAEEGDAARDALQARADELQARVEESDAELTALRARADQAETERESLRARAEQSDAELASLRARTEAAETERDALSARAAETDSERGSELAALRDELTSLSIRGEQSDRQIEALRVRAEDAEAQRDALRAQADQAADLRAELESVRARSDVPPDVARLRAELESVERERSQLRAQLDQSNERLADATQAMAPPTAVDGDAPPADARERLREARRFDRKATAGELGVDARRRGRRPAERTAKRSAAPEPTASLADKVTGWVGTVIGSRDDDEGAKNGETNAATRTRAKPANSATPTPTAEAPRPAVRAHTVTRTRRGRHPRESPSWPLRVAAIGLLALLLVALLLIVTSLA